MNKKLLAMIGVIVLIVILVFVGKMLGDRSVPAPEGTGLNQDSPEASLNEVDAITIEDADSGFTEIDKDLQSF